LSYAVFGDRIADPGTGEDPELSRLLRQLRTSLQESLSLPLHCNSLMDVWNVDSLNEHKIFAEAASSLMFFFTTKSYLHQSSRTMSKLLEKDSALQEKRLSSSSKHEIPFLLLPFLASMHTMFFFCGWVVSDHWFSFQSVKKIYFSFSLGSLEILSSFSTSRKSAAILETGAHGLI
jgi:hypothetical protein